MGNKLLILFLALMLIAPLASAAADIAFIVKNSGSADSVITRAITEAGYTYEVIDDSDITSTNFDDYGMIIVDEGNFGNLVNEIPVNEKSSLIINTYNIGDWNWVSGGADSIGSNQPLTANVLSTTSLITEGIPSPFQVYTQAKDGGLSIPMFFLSRSERSLGLRGEVSKTGNSLEMQDFVIATADVGTQLKNGQVSNARGIFFGITETEFWTQYSETLFKNSITWLIGDQDQDGDGYPANNDCNDHDANINPGENEIPYDGIDQNCQDGDLSDVDGDGYDSTEVGGDDCNDRDRTVHPGASDERKDCINKAPTFNGNLSNIEWNEDGITTIDFDSHFTDVDADRLAYSIEETSDNENVLLEIFPSGVIRFSSSENWNGTDWVVIKAQDLSGLSVLSGRIDLKVNPVNDAPTITDIADILVVEGNLIELNIQAQDVDGDTLVYSINDDKFTQEGNIFRWQTQIGDAGEESVVVSVSDGTAQDSTEFQIGIFKKIVINEFVSDPSTGKEWVELYNPGDKTFSLTNCILKDGADHELVLESSIQAGKFIVFEYSSSTLNNDGDLIALYCYGSLIDKVSYGNWDDGNAEDNAQAPGQGQSVGRDPDGKDTGIDKDDFKMFSTPSKGIANNSDLTPPVVTLNSPDNGAVYTDTRDVSFGFRVQDNSAANLLCELKINGSTETSGTFANGSTNSFNVNGVPDGNYAWNVMCYDNFTSGSSSSDRTFQVSAPDVPAIESMADKQINEGQHIEFVVQASDGDSSELTLRVENLPSGATFTDRHDKTGLFTWQTNFEQAGTYNVKFFAKDSDNLESSRIVTIIVKDVEAPLTFDDAEECNIANEKIVIDIKDPDNGDDFKIGEQVNVEIKVKNNFDEDLDFDITAYLYDTEEDEAVDDDDDSLDLDSRDSDTVEFTLELPDDTESKDFAAYVYVEDEEKRCNSAYVDIQIKREADFLVIENINAYPQIVSPGDQFDVEVDVKNLGKNDEDAYIVIENTELGLSVKGDEFEIEKFDKDNKDTILIRVTMPGTAAEKEYELLGRLVYEGEDVLAPFTILVSKKAVPSLPSNTEVTGKPTGLSDTSYTNIPKPDFYYTPPVKDSSDYENAIYNEGRKSNYISKSGIERDSLLMIIDIVLLIGIIILAVMIKIVTVRR